MTSAAPAQIFSCIQELHNMCHAEGVPTIALAIPDTARHLRGLHTRMTAPRRREVNSLLAQWTRSGSNEGRCEGCRYKLPELFVNPGALLPFGPKARRAGLWERDAVHFTCKGSRVLGTRLAKVLRPLVVRLRNLRVHVGRAVPVFTHGGSDGLYPPL